MTTQETQNLPSEEHEDDKRQVTAHLFDRWTLFHIDPSVLTVADVAHDLEEAHNDVHREED